MVDASDLKSSTNGKSDEQNKVGQPQLRYLTAFYLVQSQCHCIVADVPFCKHCHGRKIKLT